MTHYTYVTGPEKTGLVFMLNKNTWGVKKCRPIRSNIANRQVPTKGLNQLRPRIKLHTLSNNYNSLNDTQYNYYSIFSQV